MLVPGPNFYVLMVCSKEKKSAKRGLYRLLAGVPTKYLSTCLYGTDAKAGSPSGSARVQRTPSFATTMSSSKQVSVARLNDLVLGAFALAPSSEVLDHTVRYLSTWSGSEFSDTDVSVYEAR